MSKIEKIIHGVHHTHWDLEWYFTDTESIILLVYSLDEVIEALVTGEIEYYTLDGQLSILDKYFEMMPEKKPIVEKLVNENKLQVGPWYTQVDEFLTSGESFIRNLELGIEQAEELGKVMEVGYMPDSFGQSKDLPKILNGFDIDTFIFWRGFYNPNEKREFYWKSEDDSMVLASNIKHGYFEGRDLFEKSETVNPDAILQKNIIDSEGNNTLLPIGWDQRPVYTNLKEIINSINHTDDNYKLIESTYENYFKELKKENLDLNTYHGEFMYGHVSKIHRSIYSSRYDFKKLNDYLERNLVNVLEPLMLMADKLGIPYKKSVLNNIWKLVTINQAHDSLGGCNSDKTNKNILSRGTRAKEYLDATIDYLIRKITISTNNISNNDILLANTLSYKNNKLKELTLYSNKPQFIIKDANNKDVNYDVIDQTKLDQADITRFDKKINEEDIYYQTKVLLDVPMEPFSIKVLHLVDGKGSNYQNSITDNTNNIENEYYSITFDGKKLDLLLKEKNKEIIDFVLFVDDGDEGDSYDYSPAYKDRRIELSFENANVTFDKGQFYERLCFNGEWEIPQDLLDRAADKRTAVLPYEIIVTLKKNQREIDFKVNINNTAKDHRIRTVIKSDVSSSTSNAGTQFGYTVRDNEDKYLDKWKELEWREEPTSLYPLLNFVNINDIDSSFTLLTRGPKEYQIIESETNSVALTLYRSIGYLGRPDLIRRPGHASGIRTKYTKTPDAQLLKNMSFEFSIVYQKEQNYSEIFKEYHLYSTDTPYYQVQDMESLSNTMSYFMINEKENLNHFENIDFKIPCMENTELVVSSIRLIKGSIQIRLFNPNLKNTLLNERLKFEKEVEYQFINLRGKEISKKILSKEVILDRVKPGEIITIKIS